MILVTGGAGYIGSHTVKTLKAAGFSPVIFDNFSTGHRSFIHNTPSIEGDLRNPGDLKAAFRKYHFRAVLHFAGKALVGESHEDPGSYYEINVAGGLNLLSAMVASNVKVLIFSSTCATYGVPAVIPIREDHPQLPISPYGETKLAFERAMRWFGHAHGLTYLSLRYFNAAGADPEGEFREDHDPESHLIPLVLDVAAKRKKNVKIFGTDYPTPDGTCLRDYIHVTDLAEAHVAGLQQLLGKTIPSQALNLGTGKALSVRQVIETAKKVTGRAIEVEEAPRRPGDPPHLVAAPDRAAELLGWKPSLSDLDTILSTAWRTHSVSRG